MQLVAFLIFLAIAIWITNKNNPEMANKFLVLTCGVLVWVAGFRNIYNWADTDSYVICFENTPTLINFSFSDEPYGYNELGFYWLSVLVKTFTSSNQLYFLVIAAITMYYVYKGVLRFSSFPLIGLAVYIARFFAGRNMMQIRSGLAYAICILGFKYLAERDWKKYFLIVGIAYMFHHSAIIAVPLYFITYIKIRKWHVFMGMAIAFILGGFFQDTLQMFVTDSAEDFGNDITTYTKGIEIEQAKGLANPLIYYQTFLLFVYTMLEGVLKKRDKYYYIIRAAYLYSTMILTTFCMFLALSSRTSTLFATMEIAIVPSLLNLFDKQTRFFGYVALSVVLIGLFYMNYMT